MLVFNNLWDDIVINIKQVVEFTDIINDDNYKTTEKSIIIKPLATAEVFVTHESIIYLHSNGRVNRTDYLSIYSIGVIPERIMVAEQYYNSYRVNDENLAKEFDPDIVFAVSYIIPNYIIILLTTYNVLYVIILAIIVTAASIITYKLLTNWLN